MRVFVRNDSRRRVAAGARWGPAPWSLLGRVGQSDAGSMNLLPRSSKDFGSVDYWDKFFQQRGKKAFEWYGSYLELCGLLHKYIKPREKVSAAWRPGCARTPGTERGVRAGCVVGPGFPAPLGQRKLEMSLQGFGEQTSCRQPLLAFLISLEEGSFGGVQAEMASWSRGG